MSKRQQMQRPMFLRAGVAAMAILVSVCVAWSVAYAHAAVLWAYVEKGHVYVEAFFMGGNKVQKGEIIVSDSKGKRLLEGITNEEGKFDFVPPTKDGLKLVLIIDKGHASDFEITKSDFEEDAKASVPAPSGTPEKPQTK